MRHRAAFFYRDDGLVASMDPVWLQGAFNALTRLFDIVEIQTKIWKTVGVICSPCREVENQSETLYKRRMTGEGLTYRERQRVRLQCLDFGEDMAESLLGVYRHTHSGVDSEGRRQWETPQPDIEPQTYWMSFPTAEGPWECPVEGCGVRAKTRTSMKVHFLHRHVLEYKEQLKLTTLTTDST